MINISRFICHLKNVIRYKQLPSQQRQLTFYSEGKNYWVHLEGLINNVLEQSNINVCYISSDNNDPGLLIENPNYHTFKIDEGFVRNWLFENIETDVMVMTMPDLHQFQVKKSKYNVHYVYVQHSLVSLHMVYREGAFDHYDTIFCGGPHHIKEMRAIEKKYNLPPKILVEHGYARLDSIMESASKGTVKSNAANNAKSVLIAPTWGSGGLIESGICENIVKQLLNKGHKVTLRPHPMTIIHSNKAVESIINKFENNPNFKCENQVASQSSLHETDVMISDWSGVALDYAFGLTKPVIFIDTKRKINNKNYKDIDLTPVEVEIRNKIGVIISVNNIDECEHYVKYISISKEEIENVRANYVFNIRNSSRLGRIALEKICNEK